MKKKGFTLIEIIVVIALLSVIGVGSTIAIIKTNNKKEKNVLIANEDKFQNALDVYLSNHPEIVNNVENNSEGAIVSLELLKNEGLIADNLGIKYDENYYIVTKALLSGDNIEEECEDSIGLNTLASWVDGKDPSKVLYFCPKETKIQACDGSTTCPSCNETSSGITDPKEACKTGVLKPDTLACTIINKAVNAPNNVYDFTTEYEESSVGDGKTITNIGDSTILKSNNEKYYEKSAKGTIFYLNDNNVKKNSPYLFGSNACIVEKSKIVFNPQTGKYIVEENAVTNFPIFSGTWSENENGNYKYIVALNEMKEYLDGGQYVIYRPLMTSSCINKAKKTTISDGGVTKNYYEIYSYDDVTYQMGMGPLITKINKHENCEAKNGDIYGLECEDVSNNDFETSVTKDIYGHPILTERFENQYISLEYLVPTKNAERSLRRTLDDYGNTYYFRGDVQDNYVEFANMCWQVLRIQGDGSVKLLYRNKGKCNSTNISDFDLKESGYDHYMNYARPTYNYGSFPGLFNTFYNENINTGAEDYSKLLKKERFCLGVETYAYTNGRVEVDGVAFPSNKCVDSDYAKTAKSYVSSLTIDEAIFSGIETSSNTYDTDSFILRNYDFLYLESYNDTLLKEHYLKTISLTQKMSSTDSVNMYAINSVDGRSYMRSTRESSEQYVKPLVVVKAKNKVEGNGLINNPYIISEASD